MAALQKFSRSGLLLLRDEKVPSRENGERLLPVMDIDSLDQKYPSCSDYLQTMYRNLAYAVARNKQEGDKLDVVNHFMISVYYWRGSRAGAMHPEFKAIMDDVLKNNQPLKNYILQVLEG